jgi:molybdopterin adenylyltransferase
VTSPLRAKVLTVSDGVVEGVREDKSGAALAEVLVAAGFEIVDRRVVADGVESVRDALIELCDGFAGLVMTTGGTGFGLRDLTPEGTRAAIEREAPGLAESIRIASNGEGRNFGMLSRGVAGTRGGALVVNAPGSSGGAVEAFTAIAAVVPHALDLLSGGRPH